MALELISIEKHRVEMEVNSNGIIENIDDLIQNNVDLFIDDIIVDIERNVKDDLTKIVKKRFKKDRNFKRIGKRKMDMVINNAIKKTLRERLMKKTIKYF